MHDKQNLIFLRKSQLIRKMTQKAHQKSKAQHSIKTSSKSNRRNKIKSDN